MKINKQITVILLFVLMFLSILPSQKALAHDAYFLRVVVNRDTWLYEGRVEFDEVNMKGERKHAEAVLGNFSSMWKSVSTEMSSYNSEGTGEKQMLFTFPYTEIKGGFLETNDATSHDADRAYAINNVLVPMLNQMLLKINNNQPYTNEGDFDKATQAIIQASNGNKVIHGIWTLEPKTTSDVIKIYKTAGGSVEEFKSAMEKGYLNKTLSKSGKPNPVYHKDLSGDVEKITVGMLAAQGLYSLKVKQITADKLDEVRKPGLLEREISNLIISFNDGLRDLLGLHSIDELVFNQGPRMEYGYTQGVAKTSWMNIAFSFHSIMLVFASIALAFAVMKTMFEKTISTSTPLKQVSISDSIKNFFITALLLLASYPIIHGLLVLNTHITSIFGTTTTFSTIGGATRDSATIAQALISGLYIFLAVYLNIIYILRGLVIVILIASAPIFIVGLAFGKRGGELFGKWIRELTTYIFLQSIHAFILGITQSIQIGSGGLELIVISFSLIKLTKMFKSLLIGEGGGVLDDVAGNVTSAGVGAAAGMASGFAKAGRDKGMPKSGVPGKEHSADIPSRESSSETMTSLPHGSGKLNTHKGKAQSVSSDSSESIDKTGNDSSGIAGYESGAGIQNNFRKISDSENTFESGSEVPKVFGSAGVSDSGKIQTVGSGRDKMISAAKTAGKVALGAAGVATGAGLAVGLGAIAGPQGVAAGTSIMGASAGYGRSSIKRGVGEIKNLNKETQNPLGFHVGSKRLENGNVAHYRNRKSVQDIGYNEAFNYNKGAGVVYDSNKLGETDLGYLGKIKESFRDNPDSLEGKGISNVVDGQNGLTTVYYNESGKKELGFTSVTSSQSHIVEVKSPYDKPESSYIYDIDMYGKKPEMTAYENAV